jgi:hypothetical protein
MRQARLLLAVAGLACAGLAAGHAMADASALEKYPGAREQILSYYNANAREGGGNCGAGNIDNISNARVVSETDDQVVLDIQYEYSATTLQGGSERCSGTASREFTLSKDGSDMTVTNMTGQGPLARPSGPGKAEPQDRVVRRRAYTRSSSGVACRKLDGETGSPALDIFRQVGMILRHGERSGDSRQKRDGCCPLLCFAWTLCYFLEPCSLHFPDSAYRTNRPANGFLACRGIGKFSTSSISSPFSRLPSARPSPWSPGRLSP